MTTQPTIDQTKTEAFLGKLLSDTSGMTTSLSGHEEGLGTVGLPEGKLRELSLEAGFSSVRRVQLENPFNTLYEIQR